MSYIVTIIARIDVSSQCVDEHLAIDESETTFAVGKK